MYTALLKPHDRIMALDLPHGESGQHLQCLRGSIWAVLACLLLACCMGPAAAQRPPQLAHNTCMRTQHSETRASAARRRTKRHLALHRCIGSRLCDAPPLPAGGHLSHGYQTDTKKISATSIFFEVCA